MALPDDFNPFIERYHSAAAEFIKGNPAPYLELFSQEDDVTIANPFGPVARGWSDASSTMKRASSLYKEGSVAGFESLAKSPAGDLAYIVEVERFNAKIGGSQKASPVSLRATTVLRREDG